MECPSKSATCSFCFEEFPRSQSHEHAATCLDYEIPCTQANNGCSWAGPRRQFSDEHVLSCPYEAIKGFFAINSAQLSLLNTTNAALRQQVSMLESIIQTMRRDIQTCRNVLGPWYRSHSQNQTTPIGPLSINAFDHFFSAPPGPSPSSSTTNQAQPSSSADYGELTVHNEIDALAPYFPLTHEHAFQESHNHPRSRRSFSGIVDPHLSQRTLPLTPVAPLNLSTSLEGSLSGLRDSIAAVSTSVDSLARRNEIALTNESMRLNEELGSLKYAIHGIRLQVRYACNLVILSLPSIYILICGMRHHSDDSLGTASPSDDGQECTGDRERWRTAFRSTRQSDYLSPSDIDDGSSVSRDAWDEALTKSCSLWSFDPLLSYCN